MNSAPTSVLALEKLEDIANSSRRRTVVARAHHLNATPAEFVAAMQFLLSFGSRAGMQHSAPLNQNDEKSPLNELMSACADEATLRACTKALNALDLTVANSKAGNLGCSRDSVRRVVREEKSDSLKSSFRRCFERMIISKSRKNHGCVASRFSGANSGYYQRLIIVHLCRRRIWRRISHRSWR